MFVLKKKYFFSIFSVVSESDDGLHLEFDLMKVEAPIANALRRVLIAEVRRRERREGRTFVECQTKRHTGSG